MSGYKVIYELSMSWIGDSFAEIFDFMQEALDRAALVAKLHPEASGLVKVILWRPDSPSKILGFCTLYHLYEWPCDTVKEALL